MAVVISDKTTFIVQVKNYDIPWYIMFLWGQLLHQGNIWRKILWRPESKNGL